MPGLLFWTQNWTTKLYGGPFTQTKQLSLAFFFAPKTEQLCSLVFLSSKTKQLSLAFFFAPKTEQLRSIVVISSKSKQFYNILSAYNAKIIIILYTFLNFDNIN
jgi:hypothetical protein